MNYRHTKRVVRLDAPATLMAWFDTMPLHTAERYLQCAEDHSQSVNWVEVVWAGKRLTIGWDRRDSQVFTFVYPEVAVSKVLSRFSS